MDATAVAARGSLRTSLRMQTVLPFSPMACRQAPRLPAKRTRAVKSCIRLCEVLGLLEVLTDMRGSRLPCAVLVRVEGELAEHFELRDESFVQHAVQLADASGALSCV